MNVYKTVSFEKGNLTPQEISMIMSFIAGGKLSNSRINKYMNDSTILSESQIKKFDICLNINHVSLFEK